MFKKYVFYFVDFCKTVQTQTQIKSSAARAIRSKILSLYPRIEIALEEIMPKKVPLVQIKCLDHLTLYSANDKIIFVQHFDGPLYPTLHLVHAYPSAFPTAQVDRGAIKFVMSGANIMCPGFTSKGGKLEEALPAGSPVVIMAEGKEHALAIGLTKMSTDDIKSINKGIGVENIHFIGDQLWETLSKQSPIITS